VPYNGAKTKDRAMYEIVIPSFRNKFIFFFLESPIHMRILMDCRNPVHQQRPRPRGQKDTNFDAPDAHFDKLCLFSNSQAKNFGNAGEKIPV
jgi:hypothetical protein